MKKWIVGAGAASVIVIGLGAWSLARGHSREEAPVDQVSAPAASVTLAAARAVEAPRWAEATGTVHPEFEAVVAAKVMGRVSAVFVREGDTVRRGQPLLQLDNNDLNAAVTQADANLRAASVGRESAITTARMESALSAARIHQAQAQVSQAQAAFQATLARRDLTRTGPRRQERVQAALVVAQAKTAMDLAKVNRDRMESLFQAGAVAKMQADLYQSQYEVASAQYEAARQTQSMTDEGSRSEDLRSAEEAVRQAQGAVVQARAGLRQSQAAALQVAVRRQEIEAAKAQIGQSAAALQIARVTSGFATLTAPFDGIVTARLVDPGAMASPGAPLVKVQGGRLRLEVVVPESALGHLRWDTTLPVRLDALPGQAMSARVVEIAPQGDSSSHTFIVKAALPALPGPRAGMFGRVRFAAGIEPRLLVPAPAVWEREGLHYVYVVGTDSVPTLRLVTVGERVGKQIPVISGLNAGENVIAQGRESVVEGTRVRPVAATVAER